jgi:hypothetical protein
VIDLYADYDYYQSTYHGTLISAADWPQYERDASAFIDRITFGRLRHGWDVTPDVQNAVCAVAEKLQLLDTATTQAQIASAAGISSENTDGYSVSYKSPAEAQQAHNAALLDAASLWLPADEPLRYAGV